MSDYSGPTKEEIELINANIGVTKEEMAEMDAKFDAFLKKNKLTQFMCSFEDYMRFFEESGPPVLEWQKDIFIKLFKKMKTHELPG